MHGNSKKGGRSCLHHVVITSNQGSSWLHHILGSLSYVFVELELGEISSSSLLITANWNLLMWKICGFLPSSKIGHPGVLSGQILVNHLWNFLVSYSGQGFSTAFCSQLLSLIFGPLPCCPNLHPQKELQNWTSRSYKHPKSINLSPFHISSPEPSQEHSIQ